MIQKFCMEKKAGAQAGITLNKLNPAEKMFITSHSGEGKNRMVIIKSPAGIFIRPG